MGCEGRRERVVLCRRTNGDRRGTLVDSLDTLLTVGLVEEFNDALNWIHTSLTYHHVRP